jgi:hypothetical protein
VLKYKGFVNWSIFMKNRLFSDLVEQIWSKKIGPEMPLKRNGNPMIIQE